MIKYELYKNTQELLRDNQEIGAADYSAVTPTTFAFKFSDGDDCLLLLQTDASKAELLGERRLAEYAANVVADYHLTVGNPVGEKNLVDAFLQAYKKRIGATTRQALFAGGCFWCMAKPYYEYDGVTKVLSGFAGGEEVNPTYEEVKKGLTHHKETVLLEYDSAVISFKQLLEIYFDTIDPFDGEGQFIDRGDNYTCAIFTDDGQERQIATDFIADIERRFNRKVQVQILGNQVFYKAEEYHQDYALKNPEAYAEEERISGRLEFSKKKKASKK